MLNRPGAAQRANGPQTGGKNDEGPERGHADGVPDGALHRICDGHGRAAAGVVERLPHQVVAHAEGDAQVVEPVPHHDRQHDPEADREPAGPDGRHPRYRRTIAVMSSLWAAPRVKSWTSANSASISFDGSSA